MIDKVLERMITQYELYRKQVEVERLVKEGELEGLKKVESMITSKEIISLIEEIRLELIYIKAKEELIIRMNENLDENLITLDFDMTPKKIPKDVEIRMNAGLCALKRPGKGGFVCKKPNIAGRKYCLEHLEKHNKIAYAEEMLNEK